MWALLPTVKAGHFLLLAAVCPRVFTFGYSIFLFPGNWSWELFPKVWLLAPGWEQGHLNSQATLCQHTLQRQRYPVFYYSFCSMWSTMMTSFVQFCKQNYEKSLNIAPIFSAYIQSNCTEIAIISTVGIKPFELWITDQSERNHQDCLQAYHPRVKPRTHTVELTHARSPLTFTHALWDRGTPYTHNKANFKNCY